MGPAWALTGADLTAEFDRGLKAYDAGQYQAAFQIWWGIRDQDLAAARNVALMLRKGEGVAKDPRRAEEVLETAVHAHMPNAEVDLAEMYLNGEARPPEPKRAVPLLQEASDAGHPLGQYLLAQMYEDGNGVAKDMGKATELYIAASRGGLHEAKERLASLGVAPVLASVPTPAAVPVPVSTQRTNPPSLRPAVPPQTPSDTLSPKANSPKASSYVQLGAFRSADEAETVWAQQGGNALLHANAHKVVKADLGPKGVW
ncbi:MAG TPA: hypothetical protein VHY57_10040, partial [Rhizomicrobium sp.]|nr:hypothetical protein [Rhizomicrobium sp.]